MTCQGSQQLGSRAGPPSCLLGLFHPSAHMASPRVWTSKCGQDPHLNHGSGPASPASRHLAVGHRPMGSRAWSVLDNIRAFPSPSPPPLHWPQLAQGLEGTGRKGRGPTGTTRVRFPSSLAGCVRGRQMQSKGRGVTFLSVLWEKSPALTCSQQSSRTQRCPAGRWTGGSSSRPGRGACKWRH